MPTEQTDLEQFADKCCADPDVWYECYGLSQCRNCGEVIRPDNHQ